MFFKIKQFLLSILSELKSPYVNFTTMRREATSKTFQSLAIASIVGGLMRVLGDADKLNNWEVFIWIPCAIICYHISMMVLESGDK